ncbi:hypothetical protein SRABI123_05759 [Pseudomonas sp. Bi123]|nr:hypothetical protein SRABI123_05759 [Pseudomonas sp. Bi123]
MQFAHRQPADEVFHLIGRDHEQAIGLLPVAGDLGKKLVRRHAGRHGDVQLIGHPTTNILGDSRGAAAKMRTLRHVEVSLVQGKRLDQVGVIAKDRMYFLRRLSIGLHARLDDGQVRTQFQGMSGRHGRAHAISPRFIVTGSNHPTPIRRATHRQRLTGQAWVVTHLDGGVEAVTIDVDDFSLRHIKAVFMAKK